MNRRDVLRLGAIGSATIAFGGIKPLGGDPAVAQMSAPPTVDRLVLTNVVDNVYDAFARGGKLDTITVQRAALDPKGLLLFEHGLAYHLESVRGDERREILLDFAATEGSLLNNYGLLKVDPTRADALIVSHGHFDHYGALPDLARGAQGKLKPGVTLYAGGEATFCHRVMWSGGWDQLGPAGAEGVRDPEGARHRRRLPPRARVGRDRVQDRGGLQGHQPRLPHPHALQWGEHDYGRAYDDAEKARHAVHGDACDLRSITGRRERSAFGLATEPEIEPGHGEPATISPQAAPAVRRCGFPDEAARREGAWADLTRSGRLFGMTH